MKKIVRFDCWEYNRLYVCVIKKKSEDYRYIIDDEHNNNQNQN